MDSGGAVYPRQDCPHVWMRGSLDLKRIEQILASQATLFQSSGCSSCSSTAENWLCLSCGNVQCSRYVEGHSEEHWMQSLMALSESGASTDCSHCIALSMSDLSIWCYCCNQYIKHDLFTPILVKAEASKFSIPEKSYLLVGIRKKFPVGIVFVPKELSEKHVHSSGCFERPPRLEAVYTILENKSLLSKLYSVEPVCASEDTLRLVRDSEYIARMRSTAEPGDTGTVACAKFAAQGDIYATSSTYEFACYAAGSVVALTERVCSGDINRGFAAVRPPGHHAERNSASGYCFFNNIAIAVQAALSGFGLSRIMVVDFDIHHGNGCQSAFYSSNQVLHVSIHKQWPRISSPGSGSSGSSSSSSNSSRHISSCEMAEGNEVGRLAYLGAGAGVGFNVNVPLGCGGGAGVVLGLGDADYLSVFDEVVVPLAQEFQPQLLFIPAGFDAGAHDRELAVGGYSLSSAAFAQMTRLLMSVVPGGRVVAALEGGYDCRGLGESVAAVLEAMLEYPDDALPSTGEPPFISAPSGPPHPRAKESSTEPKSNPSPTVIPAARLKSDKSAVSHLVHPETEATIRDVRAALAPYWTCFRN